MCCSKRTRDWLPYEPNDGDAPYYFSPSNDDVSSSVELEQSDRQEQVYPRNDAYDNDGPYDMPSDDVKISLISLVSSAEYAYDGVGNLWDQTCGEH